MIASIPTDRKVSIERETFPSLVADGALFAMQSDAYWIDAGTPSAYLQANLDLLDGVRGGFEPGIDRTARIDPAARVSRSVVGAGATIAEGAEVIDSVVMAGARLAAGSRVAGSVVGARSSVGAGCELTDQTVVGFDHDVAAGTVVSGACFPAPESW